MPRCGWIGTQGEGAAAAGRRLASELLERGVASAVLLPRNLAEGPNAPPVLFTRPEHLDDALPFSPVMAVNTGAEVAHLTGVEPPPETVAVFLRPCESRALAELVKLKQASLDNVLLVGVDCPGTYDLEAFEGVDDPDEDLARRLDGSAEGLRHACRTCPFPEAPVADLRLGLYGTGTDGPLPVLAVTAKGEKALEDLGLEPAEPPAGRDEALKSAAGKRAGRGEEEKQALRERTRGVDAVSAYFAKCIRCQNCRTVCPVCYCRECFFDSPTFEMEGEKFLRWSRGRGGAYRLPGDTLLFHLTRLNHMGTSCVHCGMCTQACPSGIDVGALFTAVGEELQKLFDYVPGRDLDEEIPFTTFRENELATFG